MRRTSRSLVDDPQKASTPVIIIKKVPNFKLLQSRSSKSVKDFIESNKIPRDKYEHEPQFSTQSKAIGNHTSKFLDEMKRAESCPPSKRSLKYRDTLTDRLNTLVSVVDSRDSRYNTPDRNMHKLNLSRQISQNETS